MLRIGLLGGTFDPVHYGHLRIAEVVRERCHLDAIWWIPCGQPPLRKDYPISSGEDRYAMVLLATYDHPHFEVLRLEIERPGPSYTIDTVEELQRQWEGRAQFFFVLGADALLQIRSWHRYEALLQKCPFLVVNRPGYDLGEMERVLSSAQRHHIQVVEAEGLDISATEIRAKVHQGLSIRYLTPDPVIAYIHKRQLYRWEAPP